MGKRADKCSADRRGARHLDYPRELKPVICDKAHHTAETVYYTDQEE